MDFKQSFELCGFCPDGFPELLDPLRKFIESLLFFRKLLVATRADSEAVLPLRFISVALEIIK